MDPLAKPLRRQLEDAIVKARDLAEQAAQAALQYLGVGEAEAPKHLSDTERALRRRLRAHGRQLGDQRAPNGAQAIEQLAQETAYEHWHRMLFARFLAENSLLMHPEGVPLSLAECQELAQDEGAANGWELAGRYAARMLPQIFRPDSPVLALDLAPEHQRALERLLANLALETFHASDGLGWVYQFWQTKQKDRVNASEVKIGARELPAVTQLFTEPYMVAFLLDNNLGAWWAARRLSEEDLRSAESEEALRGKAAIPGVRLEYLRFVKEEEPQMDTDEHRLSKDDISQDALSQDDLICVNPCSSVVQPWTPAAGTFNAWPERLSELKLMDPCCGSGHFLVAALQMLVPMRMALEGLDARTAIDAVLRENLHGLELDQRCVEIAAFALALTAWRWPDAGGYRPLPALNLACSGLGIHASKADWLQLAEGDVDLQHALERLYELFQDAPTLGSLIDPRRAFRDDLIDLGPQRGWERVAPLVERALASEDEQQRELGVVAAGLARAAQLLANRYQCVITNVPYLARGKQQERLRDFCERHYSEAKNDLATVFLERCLELASLPSTPPSPPATPPSPPATPPSPHGRGAGGEGREGDAGGTVSVVLPQNWLFLTSYRKLREKLLKQERWQLIARLGPGAFETISGEVVKAVLLSLSRGNPAEAESGFLDDTEADAGHLIRGVDVSEYRTAAEKAERLLMAEIKSVGQAAQLGNPDARLALTQEEELPLLSEYADGLVGLQTSDDPMFVAAYWEVAKRQIEIWELMQATPDVFSNYSGQSWMVRWEKGEGLLLSLSTAYPTKGLKAVGKAGIAIHRMGQLFPYHYSKERFHQNVATIIPKCQVPGDC